MIKNFGKCGCGRTQDPDGLCDGSHAFEEEHDDSDAESVFDDDWYEEETPVKVVFVPGCFDEFDGTQEELDELVIEIQRMFESGELEANSREVDIDGIIEEEPEVAEKIFQALQEDNTRRKLQ